METLNIIFLDRDMYETTYQDGYIYIFDGFGHTNTTLYINKNQRRSDVEVTRDGRFYGKS